MLCDKTRTKELRETTAGRGGQIISCQAHRRSQQLTKSPSAQAQNAQEHTMAGRNPNKGLLRNDHLVKSPPKKWKK